MAPPRGHGFVVHTPLLKESKGKERKGKEESESFLTNKNDGISTYPLSLIDAAVLRAIKIEAKMRKWKNSCFIIEENSDLGLNNC